MPLNLDSCIAGVFTPGNIGASSGLPPVVRVVPSLDGPVPAVEETVAAVDTFDYFMGELLHEAGAASDSYAATGGAYEVLVAETATAVDTVYLAQVFDVVVGEISGATSDAPSVRELGVIDAAVTETAAATDAPDATAVSSVTYATWDPATTTNVTLSNGNLTAQHSNSTTNSGARGTAQKNSGKYYFEVTAEISIKLGDCFGIIATAGTYANACVNGTNGAYSYGQNGNIWTGGANTGLTIGGFAGSSGIKIGIAVDLDNDKVWFRQAPSGNWNGQAIGSQNPASNTGGVNISALAGTSVSPVVGFADTIGDSRCTANFGASAFTGAVPSGFTSGWTT